MAIEAQGAAPRLPEREREKERERPPPRDLLKEARERREAARKEAERAARERREAEARQAPARHAPVPKAPARRPDDQDRHAQPDRCTAAVPCFQAERTLLWGHSSWMGFVRLVPTESIRLQQTCKQQCWVCSCRAYVIWHVCCENLA